MGVHAVRLHLRLAGGRGVMHNKLGIQLFFNFQLVEKFY